MMSSLRVRLVGKLWYSCTLRILRITFNCLGLWTGLCLGCHGHQLSCSFSCCWGSSWGWFCLEEGLREESQRSSRGVSRAGDRLPTSCCGNTWGPPQDSGAADEAAGGCPGQTHRSGRVNRHLPPVPEVLPQLDARERRHDDNPDPRWWLPPSPNWWSCLIGFIHT